MRRPPTTDPRLARLGDVGTMVVALFVGGLATDAAEAIPRSYVETNELIGLAAITLLWWQRRWPVPVAAATFVAGAAAPAAGGAAIVGVYALAAHHEGRRTSRAMVALYLLYLVTGIVGLLVFGDEDLGVVGGALAALVLSVGAYGWGLAVRSRRQLVGALAERAERAEADQHARLAEARRLERSRIAAEMHDVLAHRLSLLSLHAGAIEVRPGAAPDELARAAGVVRSNAHLALQDLRAVIGVLRDGEGSPDLRPIPTLADVGTLVAESRAAGMPLDVVDARPAEPPVPPEIGRHAYQVVREALTNARKHAPGQPVRLAIGGDPATGLRIEVTNPVPPPAARAATSDDDPVAEAIPGAGVGLVGLRERVELAQGTLEQVRDGDRHRLEAWFPWPS